MPTVVDSILVSVVVASKFHLAILTGQLEN
jgi:hypothetical protein